MIDHVSVAVSDLPRAMRFYEAVLGAIGYAMLDIRGTTVGYGNANAGQHGGTRLANLEARREYRIGASNGDLVVHRQREPARRHDLLECSRHGWCSDFRRS